MSKNYNNYCKQKKVFNPYKITFEHFFIFYPFGTHYSPLGTGYYTFWDTRLSANPRPQRFPIFCSVFITCSRSNNESMLTSSKSANLTIFPKPGIDSPFADGLSRYFHRLGNIILCQSFYFSLFNKIFRKGH